MPCSKIGAMWQRVHPCKGLHAARRAEILISLQNNFMNFNVATNSNCGCGTELDKTIMELYQT